MNNNISDNKLSNISEDNVKTEVQTKRSVERKQEDRESVPVIVKRTDETVRHPDDVLEKAISEGLEQIRRPFFFSDIIFCGSRSYPQFYRNGGCGHFHICIRI